MMTCGIANREEVAEHYVEGQLCPWQQEEFEIHLLECGKCLTTVETLSEVQEELQERGGEIRAGEIGRRSRVGMWVVMVTALIVLIGASYLWMFR